MTYDILNAFAQSWMVVVMTAFFVAVMVWVLRPGSKKVYDEAANSIFRHDKNPGPVPGSSKEA
jgi:cytochrome c oxidase cbb3-type subunit 4